MLSREQIEERLRWEWEDSRAAFYDGLMRTSTHLHRNEWVVYDVPLSLCADLVSRYHYAHRGANTATFRHGLFRRNSMECLGVAWWIPPTRNAAAATYPEGDWRRVLSLSRLVIAPAVPTNGASFLLARSIRIIKQTGDWDCLVTYADTSEGYTGAIYRATNWQYCGLTAPEAKFCDSEGRLASRKRGPRTLTRTEMEEAGYRYVGSFPKHKFRMVLR